MNENMPILKSFLKRIHQTRSWVFSLLVAGSILIAFGSVIIFQRCDVGLQSIKAPDVLVGKAVTLRQLTEEYFIDYYKIFSPTVRKDLEFPAQITFPWTINYLKHEMSRVAKDEMIQYLIFDNGDKKLIGATEIRELNDYDPGQVGIWINEKYWGGGRALEAIKLISDTYFKVHPEHSSYIAHVRLWNHRSHKLLLKAGFVDEGYFNEHGEPRRYIMRYFKNK